MLIQAPDIRQAIRLISEKNQQKSITVFSQIELMKKQYRNPYMDEFFVISSADFKIRWEDIMVGGCQVK